MGTTLSLSPNATGNSSFRQHLNKFSKVQESLSMDHFYDPTHYLKSLPNGHNTLYNNADSHTMTHISTLDSQIHKDDFISKDKIDSIQTDINAGFTKLSLLSNAMHLSKQNLHSEINHLRNNFMSDNSKSHQQHSTAASQSDDQAISRLKVMLDNDNHSNRCNVFYNGQGAKNNKMNKHINNNDGERDTNLNKADNYLASRWPKINQFFTNKFDNSSILNKSLSCYTLQLDKHKNAAILPADSTTNTSDISEIPFITRDYQQHDPKLKLKHGNLYNQQATASTGNNNAVVAQEKLETRKVIIHATTSELLKCLGVFLQQKCTQLDIFRPSVVVSWIRAVDRYLILQGWTEIAFINPANVVFVFMLIKDFVPYCETITSERELHAIVMTTLYIAYCYIGNEISYPLKPFLVEDCRNRFWKRCLAITNRMSSSMLYINTNPAYFTDLLAELKSYS